jgi:hypothetical protein
MPQVVTQKTDSYFNVSIIENEKEKNQTFFNIFL